MDPEVLSGLEAIGLLRRTSSGFSWLGELHRMAFGYLQKGKSSNNDLQPTAEAIKRRRG